MKKVIKIAGANYNKTITILTPEEIEIKNVISHLNTDSIDTLRNKVFNIDFNDDAVILIFRALKNNKLVYMFDPSNSTIEIIDKRVNKIIE